MPKKIQPVTKAHLTSVPLPTHGSTYTVISHGFVIDYSIQQLEASGFMITDEEYRCTADGQIAQGVYKLSYKNDPDLSMMFAWTNSYNKQVKFQCVIGAYVDKTGSVMVSGEMGRWIRKHTGTADTETKDVIDAHIANAKMYYNQMVSDKIAMEKMTLNLRKQSQLLGVLFAEYEILTTEQASIVRNQLHRPLHSFTNGNDSLWAFYNYVTVALQSSHPKTWLEDQRILHYFISTICDFTVNHVPIIEEEDEETIEDLINDNIDIEDEFSDIDPKLLTIEEESTFEEEDIPQMPEPSYETDELNEDELSSQLYGVDNNPESVIATFTEEEDKEEEEPEENEVNLAILDALLVENEEEHTLVDEESIVEDYEQEVRSEEIIIDSDTDELLNDFINTEETTYEAIEAHNQFVEEEDTSFDLNLEENLSEEDDDLSEFF